jgi:PAS domain S-box-containing protein
MPMSSEKISQVSRLPRQPVKAVRRAADDALLIRERWLRLVAKGSPLGLWHWNVRTRSLFCDQNARRIFALQPTGDVTLDAIYQAVHPDDQPGVRAMWRRQFQEAGPCRLEYRVLGAGGTVRWLDAHGGTCYDRDRNPLYIVGVVIDITDRRRVEQERLDLQRRLLEAQEQEGRRLAQEIHDDFCQRFALLMLKLQTLGGSGSETGPVIRELVRDVTGIERDLQALSHRLYSPKLSLLGLAPSLDGLCAEFARDCGIRVRCEHADVPEDLAPETALSLFRVTQEALHNIAKHSGASAVDVHLKGTATGIVLTVFDDGAGFGEKGSTAPEGIGIRGMQDRVRILGGTLQFRSRPLIAGTRLTVTVPRTDVSR